MTRVCAKGCGGGGWGAYHERLDFVRRDAIVAALCERVDLRRSTPYHSNYSPIKVEGLAARSGRAARTMVPGLLSWVRKTTKRSENSRTQRSVCTPPISLLACLVPIAEPAIAAAASMPRPSTSVQFFGATPRHFFCVLYLPAPSVSAMGLAAQSTTGIEGASAAHSSLRSARPSFAKNALVSRGPPEDARRHASSRSGAKSGWRGRCTAGRRAPAEPDRGSFAYTRAALRSSTKVPPYDGY